MAYGDFEIGVGDEVGIVRHGRNSGILSSKFGTVTKINGHGHIFVQSGDQELRFDRRGSAYKDTYGPDLIHAAQLRAQLVEENRRKTQSKLAREIEQTVKGGFGYNGRFFTTKERLDEIKCLVSQLEKTLDTA
jgi:hypothetical protein